MVYLGQNISDYLAPGGNRLWGEDGVTLVGCLHCALSKPRENVGGLLSRPNRLFCKPVRCPHNQSRWPVRFVFSPPR